MLFRSRVSGTGHPMIMRAEEKFLPLSNLLVCLEQIHQACVDGDCQTIKNLLSEVVGDFSDQPINDVVWRRGHPSSSDVKEVAEPERSNITPMLRKQPKT